MTHGHSARSRLAGYHKRGKIWINPNIPKIWRGIHMRARVKRHEKTERKHREQGISKNKAHRLALKEEHKGLTPNQRQQYEGKLGSIARKSKLR